jgi:type IV pilus assembly protein PilE
VIVAAILASLAIPAYRDYVVRSHRVDAKNALLALATAQEKFYLECHRYATGLDAELEADCGAQRLRFPDGSEHGYYRLGITSADEVGWSATATAAGPPQDADARCQLLGLDSSGHRSARDARNVENPLECWSR